MKFFTASNFKKNFDNLSEEEYKKLANIANDYINMATMNAAKEIASAASHFWSIDPYYNEATFADYIRSNFTVIQRPALCPHPHNKIFKFRYGYSACLYNEMEKETTLDMYYKCTECDEIVVPNTWKTWIQK